MWKPIETAPKDGRLILACIKGFTPCAVMWVEHLDHSGWSVDPEEYVDEEHFEAAFFGSDYSPTHWMPLPEPPND